MRKYFTTGLVILLPIILTILIVTFLVNFLTKPFLGMTEHAINYSFDSSFLFLEHPGIIAGLSKLLILCVLISFILLIGLLGKLFLIDYLFRLGDKIIHNLPFVNKVYKACQDVVHSLFSSKSNSFSQVVFVPFPSQHALSIGLVTKDIISIHSHSHPHRSDLIPVFVPGTPNPTVGFLLMFKKEQLIFVNMKVEEAMKFIVSCGIVMSDFTVIPTPTNQAEIFHEKELRD
jgi:uncharacterized membrane protein